MLRVPVALLLLALVIPRLPAIPTRTASKHRVPRADLEDDTDELVQNVDQVVDKMNKALGAADDAAETDSDDTLKNGLSVKTTEVRITPQKDKADEDDKKAGPVKAAANKEEPPVTVAKPVKSISKDALVGNALENPELLDYFLSAGDGVPPAFFFPQKAPEEIIAEEPKPIAGIDFNDEETQEALEELEADHMAQEIANLDDNVDIDGGDLIASLGLLGPQKSIPFAEDDFEEELDDDEFDDDDDDDEIELSEY
ncbi:uncharacterized protein LOC118425482 [Branchiostoma floridae]|uniref:Uncharacterized protein LOC118425482 n=1 Tax=Branchiostoma floridae TaxID=7739 RepID=A0A9J7LVV9_BRAFL|nr:uncharacterized protein LOC118425482 [Branchiostoma floridae]